MRDYYGFYYPKRKPIDVEKELAKLRKKNPYIEPVQIEGRKISVTWWGIAWNENLESYADFASRIGRGRTYVRGGKVLDLQISPGLVLASVIGQKLYQTEIRIKPLAQDKWDNIVAAAGRRIDSLEELAEGRFPQALAELFTRQEQGLFPSPNEIRFSCSCPDWAVMCKHVAAVLYGIGNRLDSDPTLFFTLRDIDFAQLLKKSLEEKLTNMLENADNKTNRVIENADIAKLFGV